MKTFADSFLYVFVAGIIIVSFQLYVVITPISAIATKKIIDNQSLTFLQRVSYVIFPIITVPFYIILILKFLHF